MTNFYAMIPVVVLEHKELKPNEKLCYALISNLTHKTGYCFATNRYMSEKLSVGKDTISTYLRNLEKLKLIKMEYIYHDNSKEIKERRIVLAHAFMINNLLNQNKTDEIPESIKELYHKWLD